MKPPSKQCRPRNNRLTPVQLFYPVYSPRIWLLILPLLMSIAHLAAAGFKAGMAERDITPAIGMECPGGYGKVFHQRVHDPCKVRAAVVDDGKTTVAVVSVDALMVPRQLVLAARSQIQAQCGIQPHAILIGATHSHSSGPTGMVQPGEFDHASPLARKLAYEMSSCADAGYLEKVRQAVVEAVVDAHQHRTEALGGAGLGWEDKAAFNRRFLMRNGLTFTHPGKGNPDIKKVAGPIDPNVGVIGLWTVQGNFLGCIVNYACHATTPANGISANWIYDLEKVIRGAWGSNAVVVFLQGFAGDVTQVDNLSPYIERPGETGSRYVGGRVGAEAVKVLSGMARGDLSPVDARSQLLSFQRRRPEPARLKRCLELAAKEPREVAHTEWTFAKEIVLLDALISKWPEVEVELQAIQIGPVIMLTSPGEVFCQFGLELRHGSPFPITFPVELANGCAGYIPTREAFGKHGGGYETRLTSYSNLPPDAGDKMNVQLLKLARGMQPGTIPQLPKAPPFKAPWSYGNVPPELK